MRKQIHTRTKKQSNNVWQNVVPALKQPPAKPKKAQVRKALFVRKVMSTEEKEAFLEGRELPRRQGNPSNRHCFLYFKFKTTGGRSVARCKQFLHNLGVDLEKVAWLDLYGRDRLEIVCRESAREAIVSKLKDVLIYQEQYKVDMLHSITMDCNYEELLPQTPKEFRERLSLNARTMEKMRIRRQLVSYIGLTLKKLDQLREQLVVPNSESSGTIVRFQKPAVCSVPCHTTAEEVQSNVQMEIIRNGEEFEDTEPLSTRKKIDTAKRRTRAAKKRLDLPECRQAVVHIPRVKAPVSSSVDVPPTGTGSYPTRGDENQ